MKQRFFLRIRRHLCVFGMAALLGACNHLNGDPDTIQPFDQYPGAVYVSGKNPSVIDLAARVKTTVPVTFTITSQPSKGTLSPLSNGLFQYSPYPTSVKTSDSFAFSVMDAGNNILERDTIPIVIQPDSVKLPCGVYAAPDSYVLGDKQSFTTVNIAILYNDIICGLDSTEYQVSIYQSPVHGTAVVELNRFILYSFNAAPGTDRIIYKIQSAKNSLVSSYGVVTITTLPACNIKLMPDYYTAHTDSIPGDSLTLRVFNNDQFCTPLSVNPAEIVQAPQHGTAYYRGSVASPYIVYFPNAVPQGQAFFTDSLHYRICVNAICQTTTASIRVDKP